MRVCPMWGNAMISAAPPKRPGKKTIADPVAQILWHGSDFIYTNFSRGRDPDFLYTNFSRGRDPDFLYTNFCGAFFIKKLLRNNWLKLKFLLMRAPMRRHPML